MLQASKSGFNVFNILISDLFFDDLEIDLANYANNTISYPYELENEKEIIFTY